MTIRKRIIGGSFAVGVLFFVGGLLSIIWIDSGMTPLGRFHVPALNQIQFIESMLKEAIQESYAYLVHGEVTDKTEFLESTERFDQEAEKFIEIARLHESVEKEEANLFLKLRGLQKLFVEQATVLFKEYESNGSISSANFLAYEQIVEDLTFAVETLVRIEKIEVEKSSDEAFMLISQAKWSLFFLALLAIISTAASGFFISRNIVNRLNTLKTTAVAIGGGAFETHVNLEGDDELGILGKAVDDMAVGLQAKFLTEQELATTVEANLRMRREILTRQRFEQALEESMTKYRDLYDNAPDMFVSVDANTGKILEANETLTSTTGYTKEEIIGRPVFEIYHSDSLEGARHAFKVFQSTGTVQDTELQLRRKDGKKIDVSLNVSSIRDAEGKIIQSRSVLRDITLRNKAEAALKTSQEFARATMDALSAHICVLNAEGFILSVNASWKRFGLHNALLSSEFNVGDNYLEVCEQATGECSEEALRVASGIRAVIDGTQREFSTVYPCHSPNEQRWFAVKITPFKGGGPLRVVVAHENMTDVKLAEKTIRESEERTRQILEGISDMVVFKAQDSKIIWANKAFREYYGMTNQQLENLIDAPFNDPIYTKQYLEDDLAVFEKGEVQYITKEPVTRHDGEVRLFNTIKSPIFDEDGHVTHLVAVIRDMTEQIKAEEALRVSEKQLRALIDHSPYCIHQLNLEGQLISMNKAGLQMMQLNDEEEILGKFYLHLIAQKDRPRIAAHLNRAIEGYPSEFEFETPDKKIVQSSFVPINFSGKNVDIIMGMTQEITKRRQVEESFQRLVHGTASVAGGAFFDAFIEHLALAVGVRFALVTELANEEGSRLRSLSCWHRTLNQQPFEYKIENTPCQFVLLDGSAYYPSHVRELFPNDKELMEIEAESYLGLVLQGKDGKNIGHICIIHDAAIPNYDHIKNVISIFGARAAVELERMKAENSAKQALEQAQSLSRQLVTAQEEERKRIARELHDEFGQVLTGLKFGLAKLAKQIPQKLTVQSQAAHLDQFREMGKTVDTAIHTMRRIATNLRPSLLDDLGLMDALDWLVNDFEKRTSIVCAFTAGPGMDTLDIENDCALVIFRITQELLTNVLKHASASTVLISLANVANTLILETNDDGRGITQNEIDQTNSMGLSGIRERLAERKGTITIKGEKGKGTRVAIRIPLASPPDVNEKAHD